MNFELGEEDALIIESEIPDAKYWSIQLTDLWWQTLDFTYHKSGPGIWLGPCGCRSHGGVTDPVGKQKWSMVMSVRIMVVDGAIEP